MWGFGSFHVHRRGSPRAQNEDAPFGCFLMIAVPVLFAISAYFAWEELRYTLLGKTTTATVDRVIETSESYRRGNQRKLYGVFYTFQDDSTGGSRAERDDIPRSWQRPEGRIDVEYLPNRPDRSRIAGNRHYFSLVFFVCCCLAAIPYGIVLLREARQSIRESQQHEARRRRGR